jgi:hypothetical protein
MFALFFPKQIEFMLEHVAPRMSAAYRGERILLQYLPEVFADRSAARLFDLMLQLVNFGEHALRFFFAFAVRLAVAQEPAPLIQVQQDADKLARGKWFVEAAPTKLIGVEAVETCLLYGIFG